MTSLYSGTVLDSMSYCQEYNDIIVVQFDEDKPNDVMDSFQNVTFPLTLLHPCP